MSIDEFQEWCRKNNDNQFNDDGLGEKLKDIIMEFGLFCRKCQSKNVQVIGESGVDYGGMTGYSPGSNVIKCNDCGNAVTLWI